MSAVVGDMICLLIVWSLSGQALVSGQCTAVECAGDYSSSSSDLGHHLDTAATLHADEHVNFRSDLEELKLKTQLMTELLGMYRVRQNKTSPKVYLPFSEQPLGILTQKCTHLLRVHTVFDTVAKLLNLSRLDRAVALSKHYCCNDLRASKTNLVARDVKMTKTL